MHADLGDAVRLPVPQVVRRHRQIRQGVRPRRLGPRQPGRSVVGHIARQSAICATVIISAECEFDNAFYDCSGVVVAGGLQRGFYADLFFGLTCIVRISSSHVWQYS